MRRISSLLRSTPFRLALSFCFLFVLAFLLSGAVAYRLMKSDLADQLDETVKDTYSVVAATYAGADLEDLLATIDSHARLNANGDRLFSLTTPAGKQLAGNFVARDLPLGLSTIPETTPGLPAPAAYRAYSGMVGENRLTVGQSLSDTDELQAIVLISFAWASLIVTLLAIAGGAYLAARVQRRFDTIAATLVEVSHGKLDARIPLIGNGDDIDLVSGQVNAALDRLSALVEGMRQVSSDIAHDLKTPLNRLQITLEAVAQKSKRGDPIEDEMADARAESQQINATFEALLGIAQIEAGARKARFTELDLRDAMVSIAEVYADVADDDGKELTMTNVEPMNGRIAGDPELITRMLANLVENALRHCAAGTRIQLSLSRVDGRVVMAVSDDGPGIPAAEREKVFRRLYRLDKSRRTPGTGLGLGLVRAIAELHGATVLLKDNEPGLRVVVSFPAADRGASAQSTAFE